MMIIIGTPSCHECGVVFRGLCVCDSVVDVLPTLVFVMVVVICGCWAFSLQPCHILVLFFDIFIYFRCLSTTT